MSDLPKSLTFESMSNWDGDSLITQIEPPCDDIWVAIGIVADGSRFRSEPITIISLLYNAANKAEFYISVLCFSDKVFFS